MSKKGRFSRLGMKLVGVSVLGLALAFAVFYLTENTVTPALLNSEWFTTVWQSRDEAAIRDYQEYVTEHGLTVQEVLESQDGEISAGLYTIMIGAPPVQITPAPSESSAAGASAVDDTVSYSFTWMGLTGVETAAPNSVEFVMELYQIQCADGTVYLSAMPADLRYEGVGRVVGLLLALAGFCAVVVPYIVRLLRRLGALSHETGILMSGDLDHRIRVQGRDELSGLGEDIERLRRSVLERIQGEREAVAANSRLITSLSHDLRTPLTKLTGYLDILAYHKYRTAEERDRFLRLAAEKAEQIKTLTDQMFASARVDAPQVPLEQPPEAVDGAALLGQLLEEQCGDLRREGFDVREPVFDREFRLYLRTADAVRIFDNLFSNLRKYADSAVPIRIQAEDGPETAALRVTNRVRPVPDRTDSHGVGVPIMRELLERAGGTLEVSLRDGGYESVLTFPKYRGER